MRRVVLSLAAVLALLLATSASLTAVAQPSALFDPANPAFQRTWERTDYPNVTGVEARTWMWGPEANTGAVQEEYAQAPGGMRTVQYFDKSRMEDAGWHTTVEPWNVTNGLLVVELVTGRLKLGDLDDEYEQYPASTVNVAGDANDVNGPTYASFRDLLDVHATEETPAITQVIDRDGEISVNPAMSAYAIPTAHYVSDTRHWVAEPFWDFMIASGVVYEDGGYITEPLFENPYYATGFPISEPYWARVKVADVAQDVLMQCFERRCLTYTPGNEPEWRVEMGNVGQHYHHWRYEEIPTVTVDPCPETEDGTYVWVADTVNNRVQKFDDAGTFLCALTVQNTGSIMDDPWAVAVDERNDDLWVHTSGWLHRFDYRGNWISGFGDDTLLFEDIAVDGDGNVYGISEAESRVEKYAPTGTFITQWGSHGSGIAQFDSPAGIDIDDDGNIYVVDRTNQRVTMFSPMGGYLVDIGSGDVLNFPDAITVDAAGNIYVADMSVFVFDATGAPIDTWESTDDWSASHGIAIGANGMFYALDRVNSTVNYFSGDGARLGSWGDYGAEPGEFDTAYSLTTATR